MARGREISPFTVPLVTAFHENSVLDTEILRELAEENLLYVIWIMPRSGSTWFHELIRNSGGMGEPQEWFNDDLFAGEPASLPVPGPERTADINQYVAKLVQRGQGVAGTQLSYWQALSLAELADGPIPLDKIKLFYLRRRDILSQSISFYKSVATGYWHSYQGSSDRIAELPFDLSACVRSLSELVGNEARFEELFESCGVDPVRLYYEDIEADPLSSLRTFASVLDVKAPTELPTSQLRRLRNGQTEEWRRELEASDEAARILASRPSVGSPFAPTA